MRSFPNCPSLCARKLLVRLILYSCACPKLLRCVLARCYRCAKEELHMGILDDLLGGGQLQKQYKDFVNRYERRNSCTVSGVCPTGEQIIKSM